MTYLLVFLILVLIFQSGILLLCYLYRRDPLLMLPIAQRTQVLIDLLQVRNHMKASQLYAEALLGKPESKISFAHTEFLHQIAEESHSAIAKLDRLVDPGRPLSLDSVFVQGKYGATIDAERTFAPDPSTIVHYLQQHPLEEQQKKSGSPLP